MKIATLTVMSLVAGAAGAANAQTGFYVLGEGGGARVNLDIRGNITGANQPTYDIGRSETEVTTGLTIGGGYNFQLADSALDFGLEGQLSFVNVDENAVYNVGSQQILTYLSCPTANRLPDGNCINGSTIRPPTAIPFPVDDSTQLNLSAGLDFTATALFTVGYTFDRLRVSAGAGPALANVNVNYAATGFSTSLPVRDRQGFLAAVTPVTGAPEQFDDSDTLSGWAARLGVDYQATDAITLGLHYQYADFGEADFSGVRIPDLQVGALSDSLKLRLTFGF